MHWYYALDNARLGPVDQATFDQLAQAGTITPQTLVWHAGLVDWQPLAEVARPASAPATGGIRCSECRGIFPIDQVVKLGSGHVCAACKPIALQKLREGILGNGTSEQIRQEHLQHEASIKSVGMLYFIGAAFIALVGSMAVVSAVSDPLLDRLAAWFTLVFGGLFVGLAALFFVTGLALRKFKPWARIASGVLAGLGLLAIPLGTVVNAYILWLLFSRKGAMVFSGEYRRVMVETPHIRYKTSVAVRIVLGIVATVVLFWLGAALLLGLIL